jgi:hypothetical protein
MVLRHRAKGTALPEALTLAIPFSRMALKPSDDIIRGAVSSPLAPVANSFAVMLTTVELSVAFQLMAAGPGGKVMAWKITTESGLRSRKIVRKSVINRRAKTVSRGPVRQFAREITRKFLC